MSIIKTREEMMAILAESLRTADPNDRHKPLIRTTEDFWGEDVSKRWANGIWLCGECGYTYMGRAAFNYYNESNAYKFGIFIPFDDMLYEHGWYAEWYDPGTIFIFEI